MAPRLQLHELLLTFTDNVYFQPPTNTEIKYPCIVYQRNYALTAFADDIAYRHTKRYQITVIDQDPDSPIPDMVAEMPMSAFNRFYTAENLNHDVFNVFF